MNEFELSEFSSMEDERIAPRSSSCLQCKKYVNNRKLMPVCNCANGYLHVSCLKEITNKEDILYCPCCNARYPLEIRPELLSKMFWKICIPLFTILYLICINFITVLTVYLILSIDVQNQLTFIVKIIFLGLFLWSIYMTVLQIDDWSKRIYEPYHQWCKSTYEWKLIRPSTDNNIEEYNIEET